MDYKDSVLDTLMTKVSLEVDRLHIIIMELNSSIARSNTRSQELARAGIKDHRKGLQSALREAQNAITTGPPTSTLIKSLSTSNDILEAIEENARRIAAHTKTIASNMQELGKVSQTGDSGSSGCERCEEKDHRISLLGRRLNAALRME